MLERGAQSESVCLSAGVVRERTYCWKESAKSRLLQLTAVADTNGAAWCSACRDCSLAAKLWGNDLVSAAAEKLCSNSWLSTPYTSRVPSDDMTSSLTARCGAEASATSTRHSLWAAGTDAGS